MTQHIETLAVHAGQEQSDPATKARAVPIYQTTSYTFDSTEHAADLFALRQPGYIYTRIMNPTQNVFEERVNALEGGIGALATASGAAAIDYAVRNLCSAGDNFVASSKLYGGTFALFAHTLPQFGIECRFVDPDDPSSLDAVVDERTKLVFGESLGNPAMNVLDVRAWADAAHAHGLPLVIDNTVPTPYLCRVFDHGADIAVHAATKYMGGHGTTMGGIIVDSGRFDWVGNADRFPNMTAPDHAYHGVVWTDAAGPAAYIIRARTIMLRNTGAAISPFNAWQLLQGLETLHLRMDRHSSNAMAVAKHLQSHPAVAWVNYPGLEGDRYHEAAKKTLDGRGFGGLVSFGLKAGRAGGSSFIESLKVFSHLANIGDAKSLAIHNATTTHSQLTEDELVAAGVAPEGVRLSIGIENVDDLIADLDQALAAN
ncbi:O-acetylhomoserine aminocarboxypropyltransferase/cysteine synthase family protein [Propioniciclava tarda]|mgnify:FL=1|uniref:Bifunctional O-acetylhomoserine aminocarboxypropyltransferase/cysteine synthase n=1 Tax=Propioniciclava tarda TaxID=433330 RepID=A0A4Q9KMY0_PROTD|nr:PLP-dependent transferase [Propioniciclava tarda]TBT95936.1 bifunctional O-acetylhomoserine aminocarboxypropyltransferase/cysteine synthase [Propioniciclava tarda]SMO41600.1 O-acetylhomoserine sulfhydrylase [Propioniciclava tarda]HQA30033.1 PLP-dependent transferase [Propioniciclava tarda]